MNKGEDGKEVGFTDGLLSFLIKSSEASKRAEIEGHLSAYLIFQNLKSGPFQGDAVRQQCIQKLSSNTEVLSDLLSTYAKDFMEAKLKSEESDKASASGCKVDGTKTSQADIAMAKYTLLRKVLDDHDFSKALTAEAAESVFLPDALLRKKMRAMKEENRKRLEAMTYITTYVSLQCKDQDLFKSSDVINTCMTELAFASKTLEALQVNAAIRYAQAHCKYPASSQPFFESSCEVDDETEMSQTERVDMAMTKYTILKNILNDIKRIGDASDHRLRK